MTVLLTGYNGMLGRSIAQTALGPELYGIDLAGPHHSRCRAVDITNEAAVRRVVKERAPSCIIHSAAWTNVDACEADPVRALQVNGEATRTLAACARESDVPLVLVSTDYVFDGTKHGAYEEHDVPCPCNAYGRSKYAAEEAVRTSGARYVIVRTSWLFGGDSTSSNFVTAIIRQYRANGLVRVVNDQWGKPTGTGDLARAIERIVAYACRERTVREILHCANAGPVTWYTFAQAIVEAIGGEVTQVVPITSAEVKRPAPRPANSVLATDKFEHVFSCRMRPWQDALADYMAVLKQGSGAGC